MSARRASRAGLTVACLAVGCGAAPVAEYDAAEAAAAGVYAGPPRWTIRAGREVTRPLDALCRWRPPAAAHVAGLGVVVGLRRTGDHGADATQLLEFWQQQVAAGAFRDVPVPERPGSAALVAVEAVLPADAPPESAEVRPIANATSLEGGRLLQTELKAGTATLATAEGPLILARVGPDGTVVRDPRRGRVATVTPRRAPDTRRIDLEITSPLPGAAAGVAILLRGALPGARVAVEPGPPTRVVATLDAPVPADDVAALLRRPCAVPVAEPGAVVVTGGAPGSDTETVALLGPEPALGLVNLRIPRPTAANPAGFLRLVGVPAWQGRPVRRALVEFDAPDGRRVRVVCSNVLAELVPVLDRVGLSVRELALYLSQARTAGALAAVVVAEFPPVDAEAAGR